MPLPRRHLLALLAAAPAALPQDPDSDFTPLFDGSSLNGWTIEHGPDSAFYVQDGAVVIHPGSNFPTWLRSLREYENFELRGDIFIDGWANSGLYLHAPRFGRPTWCGLKVNIFQKNDDPPLPESMGAIFPLVAPRKTNVRAKGQWNSFRVRLDWPAFQLWINDELVQDLDLASHPDLRYRLRRGYLGLESLSYPLRFRNFRIKELPSKEQWEVLYDKPTDLTAHWQTDNPKWLEKSKWETLGPILRGDGLGYLATRKSYRDFRLHMYVRASQHSNGGIYLRCPNGPGTDHYEIQLHDVEGAVYPTGSLYGIRRATWPAIEPEQWFLLQVIFNGPHCIVRVNGDTVVDYQGLKNLQPGPIAIQAHQSGKWIEYRDIRITTP